MNKITITLTVLLMAAPGCSREPRETRLSQNVLLNLDPSEINEITIRCVGKGGFPYGYYFSIEDPEKIKTILELLQDATQIPEKHRLHRPIRPIAFKTKRMIYWASIGWNDQVVYGDWEDDNAVCHGRWESAKLLEKFKEWNLLEEIAAADPNLAFPNQQPPDAEPMPPMPSSDPENQE